MSDLPTGPEPPQAWLVIMVRAWRDDGGLRIRLTASGTGAGPAGTGDDLLYATTTRADHAAGLVREWLHRLPGNGGDGTGYEPDDKTETPPA